MSIQHYQRLNEAKHQDWLSQLNKTHALIEKDLDGKTLPDLGELIEQMRAERNA